MKADGVSGSYSVRYVDLLVLSHQSTFQHLSLNFEDSAFGIPVEFRAWWAIMLI